MKITKISRERPFSVIEKGGTFKHDREVHMRLDRDDHIDPNTGFTINAVNLERGELKHFDKNEFVKICDAELVIMEPYEHMFEMEKDKEHEE